MKSLLRLSVAATALLITAAPVAAQVRDYREIKTPALRKFDPPKPRKAQLPNGMTILLMEDRELPLIRAFARIRGGSREVPADKTGLTGILGQSWRTGGTTTRTGDQLDEFLESRAAIVETSASEDSTSVSMNVLKQDFEAVFPIFLDLLRNPAFRQDKIDLAKTLANTAISRRNDEPSAILGRESTRLGYGPDSPYARQPEYATIASITRDDLVAFHRRFVHPNNIVFGIVGDFDAAQMENRLRQAFASWPRGPQAPPPPAPGTPSKPGVYFVGKEDVNQSNIALVHGGVLRSNPDYAALQVLNDIMNNDRLFPRIRTEQGLAYSVGGGVSSGWDRPGLFRVTMGTKSESTLQAVESLRKELNALHAQPFTQQEIERAKEAILNAYIFTMDSRAEILGQYLDLEFYGYPLDFYQRYPARVQAVTAADVARVAKQYVTPDKVSLLVVGKEKDFDKPLSTLGTVTPIDITIPEPASTRPQTQPAPSSGNADGTQLLKKVEQFAGGASNLQNVRAVRYAQAATRKTPQGELAMDVETVVQFPDRYRATMRMPMGEITMVVTPESAFSVLPGAGTRDMPASQRDQFRAEARHDIIAILKYPERYSIRSAGTEKVGDTQAAVLEVTAEGDSSRWLIDPASGRVLRKITTARGPMAQGDQVTEYTEWKSFNGVMFPTAAVITSNGEQIGTSRVTSVEVNPSVEASQFQRPAA